MAPNPMNATQQALLNLDEELVSVGLAVCAFVLSELDPGHRNATPIPSNALAVSR